MQEKIRCLDIINYWLWFFDKCRGDTRFENLGRWQKRRGKVLKTYWLFVRPIDFKNFRSSLLPSPEVLKVQLKFNSTGFIKESKKRTNFLIYQQCFISIYKLLFDFQCFILYNCNPFLENNIVWPNCCLCSIFHFHDKDLVTQYQSNVNLENILYKTFSSFK